MVSDTAKAFKYGKMAQGTRATGKMIIAMARVVKSVSMEMYMKVTGSTAEIMDEEHISILMDKFTLEAGKKTNHMDSGLRCGQMDHNLKETTLRGKSMAQASLNGQIIPCILVNFTKIACMAMEYAYGVTAVNTKVNRKTINCMVKVYFIGKMVVSILENLLRTKNRDSENLSGLMEENTKVNGLVGSNMV